MSNARFPLPSSAVGALARAIALASDVGAGATAFRVGDAAHAASARTPSEDTARRFITISILPEALRAGRLEALRGGAWRSQAQASYVQSRPHTAPNVPRHRACSAGSRRSAGVG